MGTSRPNPYQVTIERPDSGEKLTTNKPPRSPLALVFAAVAQTALLGIAVTLPMIGMLLSELGPPALRPIGRNMLYAEGAMPLLITLIIMSTVLGRFFYIRTNTRIGRCSSLLVVALTVFVSLAWIVYLCIELVL